MPELLHQAAHGPAELAPFESEHHHWLRLVVRPPPRRSDRLGLRCLGRGGRSRRRGRLHVEAVARRRGGDVELLFRHRLGNALEERRATDSARRCRAASPGSSRPLCAVFATSSAPAKVAPAEMPQKMPSFCASSRAHCSASAPLIGMNSSIRPAVDGVVRELGDEVRRPALHQMGTENGVARAPGCRRPDRAA